MRSTYSITGFSTTFSVYCTSIFGTLMILSQTSTWGTSTTSSGRAPPRQGQSANTRMQPGR
eukprot:1856217-Pyramimonas_sp.AAC.1